MGISSLIVTSSVLARRAMAVLALGFGSGMFEVELCRAGGCSSLDEVSNAVAEVWMADVAFTAAARLGNPGF